MGQKYKIREEAARWFLWLREHKAQVVDMDLLKRWQSIDPEHRQAYADIESFWRVCGEVDQLPWPTADELNRDNYDGGYPLPLPELPLTTTVTAAQRLRKRYSPRMVGMAACLLLLILAGSATLLGPQYFFTPETLVYETATAEQRSYTLQDGSIITLGARSAVVVGYNETERRVQLQRGEAYFEVAKQVDRPFVVDVGETAVEAVGTAFNINKRARSLVVSVLEGVVKVAKKETKATGEHDNIIDAHLAQGQQIIYEQQSGVVRKLHNPEMLRATSWRNGNLAYVSERLDKVVEDVNRYSEVKLVIGDPEVADFIFTGTIINHDVNEWLQGLVKSFPLRLLRLDNQIILLSPFKAG